jgi:putative transcriptional regulator
MNNEMFDELLASVLEGGEILRGQASPSRIFVIPGPDVKSRRTHYRLSHSQFAARESIRTTTLRNWKRGCQTP